MIEVIEIVIASHFGINCSDFLSESKSRKVTDARHFLWYILNTTCGIRPGVLAKLYKTSRQNIHYSLQQVRDGIELQNFYSTNYQQIIRKLKRHNIV